MSAFTIIDLLRSLSDMLPQSVESTKKTSALDSNSILIEKKNHDKIFALCFM